MLTKAGSIVRIGEMLTARAERRVVKLTISFDGAWQRAASRRLYNSQSGHGFIVGQLTRKIIGHFIFSKTCKSCEISQQKDHPNKKPEELINEVIFCDNQFKIELDKAWASMKGKSEIEHFSWCNKKKLSIFSRIY